MTHIRSIWLCHLAALLVTVTSSGCISGFGFYNPCGGCTSNACEADGCGDSCNSCNSCGGSGCYACCGGLWGKCFHRRTLAIPDVYPLGSTIRAHFHTMETNAEATDFVLNRHEFVGSTAELTPDGKDHIVEIAGRMRSAPFPVLVERSENNSDPELDQHRRAIVSQILTDFGNPDADQRTMVSPAYAKGHNSRESETDFYRFIYSRGGFGNQGNNGNGFGGGGSFGGGAGGGFGF